MEALIEHLPEWAILIVAVVYVVVNGAFKFVERSEKKRHDAAAKEAVKKYRESRSSDTPIPPVPFPRETTGAHDVRLLIEQDREMRELSRLSRENNETLLQIARSMAESDARIVKLLERTVEMLEAEREVHTGLLQAVNEQTRAFRVLVFHLERLHDLDGDVAEARS